jgi:hypothetical protein
MDQMQLPGSNRALSHQISPCRPVADSDEFRFLAQIIEGVPVGINISGMYPQTKTHRQTPRRSRSQQRPQIRKFSMDMTRMTKAPLPDQFAQQLPMPK